MLSCKEQSTIVLIEVKHSFLILCVLYQNLHFLFVHLLVREKQLFIVLHSQLIWVFCIYIYRSNCTATPKGYSTPSLSLLHRQRGLISPWHYQRVQQYSGGLGKLCWEDGFLPCTKWNHQCWGRYKQFSWVRVGHQLTDTFAVGGTKKANRQVLCLTLQLVDPQQRCWWTDGLVPWLTNRDLMWLELYIAVKKSRKAIMNSHECSFSSVGYRLSSRG